MQITIQIAGNQYTLALEHKNDRTWTYSEFHDIEDAVLLRAIDCNLALKDVYAKVV